MKTEQQNDQTEKDIQEDKIENKIEIDNQAHKVDEESKPIQLKYSDESERMEKEEKLVTTLIGWFEQWEAWRKPFESLWDQIYKLYFSVVENQKTPTRAKIFIPLVFQVIEAAIPKIMTTLFGQEEFFDVDATDHKDDPQADVIKLIIVYQLAQANFFVKTLEFIKQLLLYGTSYAYVFWQVKRKWVWERTPIRKEVTLFGLKLGSRITGWNEKKSYKVVSRRPEIEILDVMDVFPDPEAKDDITNPGRGVFVRYWKSKSDIEEMGKGKYPIFDSQNVNSDNLKGAQYTFSASRRARLSTRNISDPAMVHKDTIEILAFWGEYDLDEDGIKEEVLIEIGSRKVLLRAKANEFHHQKRPIIRSVFYPIIGEWFGLGLIEPVIPLQHELNTIRRQRLDNVNMILNAMWKVNSLADIDLDTLVSSPNGIILTDDMQAIERLAPDNITQNAYIEAAQIQSDIESATAPKAIQGNPQSGSLGRTAKGAQLIISQALEKFGMAIKLLEETYVKRVLRMFHQLNLQFIDDDETLRNKGLYGHLFEKEITPEMIRAEVDFKMLGISEMIGKEAKINQITSFLGVFKDILAPNTITKLARKVWKLMGFNPDDVQDIQGATPTPNVAGVTSAAPITNQVGQNEPQGPIQVPGVPPIG